MGAGINKKTFSAVPHGFSEIRTKSIAYQVIRIDPKKVLPLK